MFFLVVVVLNFVIIVRDFKIRKISNNLLLVLLWSTFLYKAYLWLFNVNDLYIIIGLFAAFFLVYKKYKIWWWDIKYIIVLWYILWYNNFFIFLWNIGLITIIYFLYEFIYEKKYKLFKEINFKKLKSKVKNNKLFIFRRTLFLLFLFSISFIISSYLSLHILKTLEAYNITSMHSYFILMYFIIFQLLIIFIRYIFINFINIKKKRIFYILISFLIPYFIYLFGFYEINLLLFKWTIFYILLTQLLIYFYLTFYIKTLDKSKKELSFSFWFFIIMWFILTYLFWEDLFYIIKNILLYN